MRHRIVTGIGFGNPAPVLLDNEGELPKKFADEAYDEYFKKFEGFDFKILKTRVDIGVEPGYQYEPLKIISINKDKRKSYICTGRAFGGYGTQLVTKTKFYIEYKYQCKFVRFIDKWHKELFK